MKKILFLTAMVIIALGFTACTDDNPTQQGQQTSDIDISNLDTSARPGDDFYQYACGGWIKNNPLPPAYSRYGSSERLSEENQVRINAILNELQTGNFAAGSTEQKLADLYRLAMDSQRRNQQGVEPLMGIIRQMEQATTVEQLFQIHLQLVPEKFYAFLITNFAADVKNSKMNILMVNQGGIGMGLKEYYLDNATADIREAYKQTIVKMFCHFGFTEQQASQKMANVMHMETELAKVSRSLTELRDPEANYNKMSLAQFNATYPHIQLEKLMNAMNVPSDCIQNLVVGQPDFCAGADQLMAEMSADELAVIYQTHEKELALEESEAKTTVYRILAVAAFLICLFVAYMFWRAAQYNNVLFEKNRRLLAEMEQREREERQDIEQLKAEPEELLTASQQLYRRLCELMIEQQPFTDETLNRETLAQLLGTNPKYIDQAITGCSNGDTTRDFINRYRLEHVACLLKTTDDPIAIIGELAGIPSRATLARLFRDYYGMTPSEYRQAARAELKQN